MGMPSGTSSMTTRPGTPSGQGKVLVEVFKASIAGDLDVREPRLEWS